MSKQKRDYYEVLGLTKTASDQDLKRAYRKLAMEFHPDRNHGNREAEERFKEVSEAYQVLSEPEKRQRYDQFGHQGVGTGDGFSGFGGFDDLFSAFADMFGGGGSRIQPGEDIQMALELTLLEAAKGLSKEISVDRHTPCNTCQGTGAKPGTSPTRCRTCQGTGQVGQRQGFFTIATECPTCHGQGRIITDKCTACHGTAQIAATTKVTVNIPAGVDDGTRLRMPGYGDPSTTPGGPAGDLYIVFQVKTDPRFVRRGDDLWTDVPLSIVEATLGTKLTVPTLDGYETISVSPGTQPMEEHILRGRGIPNVRGRGQGNLIVRFVVQIPTKLSAPAKDLLSQLEPDVAISRGEDSKEAPSAFGRLFRSKKKK